MLLRLFIISILLFSNVVYAKTIICPSVEDIKNKNLNGWIPFYIDGEMLVKNEDVVKFRETITAFKSAKWNSQYFATAHCYYSGSDAIANKVTLGQQAWSPRDTGAWRWIRQDEYAVCESNVMSECGFKY